MDEHTERPQGEGSTEAADKEMLDRLEALLSGNLPGKTEVASVRVLTFIENGNRGAASAVAAIMLLVALLVILLLDVIQRRLARRGD